RIGTVGGGVHTTTFIAGIDGATVDSGTGTPVYVDANGQLGTMLSSARYKEGIRDMGDTSALLQLRPVRFRYTPDRDPRGVEQYGLVAEEVAQVAPGLVVYDKEGQPQSVRYHFINAMLLNEVQQQARVVHKQAEHIADLEHQGAEEVREMTDLRRQVSGQ